MLGWRAELYVSNSTSLLLVISQVIHISEGFDTHLHRLQAAVLHIPPTQAHTHTHAHMHTHTPYIHTSPHAHRCICAHTRGHTETHSIFNEGI